MQQESPNSGVMPWVERDGVGKKEMFVKLVC